MKRQQKKTINFTLDILHEMNGKFQIINAIYYTNVIAPGLSSLSYGRGRDTHFFSVFCDSTAGDLDPHDEDRFRDGSVTHWIALILCSDQVADHLLHVF